MAASDGKGNTFSEGLAYGSLGLGSSLGDVLDFFGAPEHGKAVREFFDTRRKDYAPAESIQGNVVDNPELLKNLEWWSYNLGQIAPSIASSVIPGLGGAKLAQVLGAGARGIQIAGAAGAGISGGLLEAAGAYREAKDRGFSDEEARKVFVGMGLGSALLNAIPAGTMLGKGGLVSRAVGSGLAEGVTEGLEEPLQSTLMGDPLSEGIKQGLTVAPVAFVSGLIGGGAGGAAAPRAAINAEPNLTENINGQVQEEIKNQDAGQETLLSKRAAEIAPPISVSDAVNATQVETPAAAPPIEMPQILANEKQVSVQPAIQQQTQEAPPAQPPTITGDGQPPSGQPWIPRPTQTLTEKIGSGETPSIAIKSIAAMEQQRLLDQARRANPADVMSDIAVETKAMELLQDQSKVESLLKRKPGETLNVEETRALQFITKKAGEEISRVNAEMLAKKRAGTLSDADRLAYRKAYAAAAHAVGAQSGAATEAGRTLRILSRPVTTESGASIADILASTGGVENIDDQIEMYAALEEAGATEAAKAKFRAAALKITRMDKIIEAWKNGLLSGPPTHVTNIMSNGITTMLENVERGVAALIGKLHGGDKVTFGEVKARMAGTLSGVPAGLRAAKTAFITEDAMNYGKQDIHRKAIEGTLGKVVRFPGYRLLGAEDAAFKMVNYSAELHALAYVESKKTGKSMAEIIANPPEAMVKKAQHAADVSTFSNELGPMGKAIQKIVSAHPWMQLIVPFVKTPSNIIKYALKRSLIARVFSDVRAELNAGGRAADIAMARIATGTAIGTTVIAYAAQGLITGQGPDDPRERDLLRQQGWMPYALKIGDQYYSYQRMEPFGVLIGMAADAAEMAQVMDSTEAKDIAALLFGSITRNLTNKTYLKGLSDMVEAINDPQRYGPNFVKQFAGSVVPTALAVEARSEDPYLRRADSIMDQIRSRIPGLRDNLLPKLDRAGNPIKLDDPAGPDRLSPIYQSTEKRDIVAKEIYRLHKQGYDVPTGGVTDRIRGHKLSAEQHNAYIKYSGEGWRALENLMQRQGWESVPDTKKAEIVSDIMRRYRKMAGMKTIIENPSILSQ